MYAFEDTGASPYFEVNNRNKRSVAVDMKKPQGVALVRRLVANSDVFIQNFRPGIAEKIGLDYETLRSDNPLLVYGSASAYGAKGPERTGRAYDLLGQARSGLLFHPSSTELQKAQDGGLADQMGAIMLAYGVLAALVARERHGVGQRVDTSLFGSMLSLRGLALALELMTQDGRVATSTFHKHMGGEPPSRQNPGNPLWNTYAAADGKWIAMAMVQSDPHWLNFLEALGRPEPLASDPRFADHITRCQNARVCVALLDDVFATRTRPEWMARSSPRATCPSARSTPRRTSPTIPRPSPTTTSPGSTTPSWAGSASRGSRSPCRRPRPACGARRPSSVSTPRTSSSRCSAWTGTGSAS